MPVIWVDLHGFDYAYRLSSDGQVWSPKLKRTMKLKQTRCGYNVIRLMKNGKQFCTGIHRLLCMNFIGNPPTNLHVVNHKNGNRLDNRLENLEWCTPQENSIHAFEVLQNHKNMARGFGHNKKAKFTDQEIIKIRQLRLNGFTYKKICAEFDDRMSIQCCRYICIKKVYTHILN